MLVEVLLYDAQVLGVRSIDHVEGIADQRHAAHSAVDRDIADHAPQLPARQAEVLGFPHDVARQRGSDDIPDHRDETDDRIKPDREARTRNHEAAFEQMFHRLDPLADRRRIGAGRQFDPQRARAVGIVHTGF